MKRTSDSSKSARLLVYDIETSANVGLYFGPVYDARIAKVVQHHYVFGFAYKYVGQRKVYSCYIWDFPLYKRDPRNDIEVVKRWHELMNSADVVIGHNSNSFDNRVMLGRVMMHKLGPVNPTQTVDTMRVTKRLGKFDSYKLDDLCEQFGLQGKLKTNADLWWDCMQGEPKAQKYMVKYNKRDVTATEKLYLYIRPYDNRHPNMANIIGRPQACPNCGHEGPMWAQGERKTKTGKNRVWQCQNCLSKFTTRKGEPGEKPVFV